MSAKYKRTITIIYNYYITKYVNFKYSKLFARFFKPGVCALCS
jgi:hypothetical protein